MKRIFKITIFSACLLIVSSCELDLLDNPSRLTPDKSNIDFLLNSVQLRFTDFFREATDKGMDITRMHTMGGSKYNSALFADAFDGLWGQAYAEMFPDMNVILEKAAKEEKFSYHAGMASVLKAYTLITLVDYFGDIPYSEAVDPNNTDPKLDPANAVYNAALIMLDNAISYFNKASAKPANDLFYYGDASNWKALANTLKLKIFIQTRLVDAEAKSKINTLLTSGVQLIDEADGSEDFVFLYPATSLADPNNYHPWFTDNYTSGANKYQSNSYINEMYRGKSVVDPRIRYYYYRQTLTIPTDPIKLLCAGEPRPPHYTASTVFCSVADGYFGRDHLNRFGAPPDGYLKTNYGLYPVGGQFDDDSAETNDLNDGAKGKGIWPIMLASYVSFMKAEAALILDQNAGNAKTLLEDGVRKSIRKVMEFNPDVTNPAFVPSSSDIDKYVNEVLTKYDNANADGKLDVIIKEYWLALFGNGIEAYNAYRRTGHPTGLQPPLDPDYGDFWRSYLYPSAYVLRNKYAKQKADPKTQVFWDTNPPSSRTFMY
jgi:Starch-binding associating with outer membrane